MPADIFKQRINYYMYVTLAIYFLILITGNKFNVEKERLFWGFFFFLVFFFAKSVNEYPSSYCINHCTTLLFKDAISYHQIL